MKSARRSKCIHCGHARLLSDEADQEYVNEYGAGWFGLV
jgi:hypothetical protein